MKKILLSSCVLALIVFASCKKDNNGSGDSKAITKENVMGNYRLTSLHAVSGGVDMDVTQQLNACQQDDTYGFNANDVFNYTDAGTQCDVNGTFSDTWALTGDVLNFDGQDIKVTRLTATILEGSYSETGTINGQQVTSTLRYVFTRQ